MHKRKNAVIRPTIENIESRLLWSITITYDLGLSRLISTDTTIYDLNDDPVATGATIGGTLAVTYLADNTISSFSGKLESTLGTVTFSAKDLYSYGGSTAAGFNSTIPDNTLTASIPGYPAGGHDVLSGTGIEPWFASVPMGTDPEIQPTGEPTLDITVQLSNGMSFIAYPIIEQESTASSSLQVNLDDTKIYPTKTVKYVQKAPTGLNLSQFFGTESITAGITVTNNGSAVSPAGSGDLVLSVSTDPNAATDGALTTPIFTDKTFRVPAIAAGASSGEIPVAFTVQVRVPYILNAGTGYYFVATLTPKIKGEETASMQETANPFEFLGTPAKANMAVFQSDSKNSYFAMLQDATSGILTIDVLNPGTDPSSEDSFIDATEGDQLEPYIDNADAAHPTIGVGINLDSVDSSILGPLVSAVKAYYASHTTTGVSVYRTNISNYTSAQVLAMLKRQARAAYHGPNNKFSAPAAIDPADDNGLYTDEKLIFDAAAADELTNPSAINSYAMISCVDLGYNVGVAGLDGYTGFFGALNLPTPDYVMAGFQLANSKNFARDHVFNRTTAQYENLFQASAAVAANSLTFVNSEG